MMAGSPPPPPPRPAVSPAAAVDTAALTKAVAALGAAAGARSSPILEQAVHLASAIAAQQQQQQQVQHLPQHHPPRTPIRQAIPGITDRRHEGFIQSVVSHKDFGFIRCPALQQVFPNNDIFVHRQQMGAFKVNDRVSFTVYLGREGKPQASDVGPPGSMGYAVNGGAASMASESPVALQIPSTAQTGAPIGVPLGPMASLPSNAAEANAVDSNRSDCTWAAVEKALLALNSAPQVQEASPQDAEELMRELAKIKRQREGEDLGTVEEEVEVPARLLEALIGRAGAGIEDLKRRAGGDVTIQFGGSGQTRTAKIRGPAVSARLGACLVLQRVSELL